MTLKVIQSVQRRLETEIKPPSGLSFPDLSAVWRARDLIIALVLSDLRSRHRQTIVGFAWNLISPFIAMVVFTILFGQLGAFPSEGLPYPLFFFSAYFIWQFFLKAVGLSVPSLASNSHLIAKVFFPRLVVLIFPIVTAMVDLFFYSVVLSCLYIYYGVVPALSVLLLPLLVVMTSLAALSISSWLAPLNVFFRDIQIALPAVLQVGFFVTPVVFSTSSISEHWRWVVYLNPMAAIVEASRWALVGGVAPPASALLLSAAMIMVLLAGGLMFFQRAALTMVDRL